MGLADICLIFEVHQPFRLNRMFHLDLIRMITLSKDDLFELYFDNRMNREVLNRAAERCYLPANDIILNEIDRSKRGGKKFKIAYSLSGTFIEQCEMWRPDVLESFKQMVKSGCVEIFQFSDRTPTLRLGIFNTRSNRFLTYSVRCLSL